MKNTLHKLSIVLISILFMFPVTGCRARDNNEGDNVHHITERMFVTQINHIALNQRNYMGRTLRFEGIFRHMHWDGRDFFHVFRFGPGCCSPQDEIGFEVSWDPNHQGFYTITGEREYPNTGDWVEVIGELSRYEIFGFPILFIALSELNVLETRGAEFVIR